MDRRFLKALWKDLSKYRFERTDALESQIKELYLNLLKDSAIATEERSEAWHRDTCCMVLAAYRTIKSTNIPTNHLLSALQHAISAPNSRIIRNSVRLKLFLARDPMEALVQYNKKRIPQIYGKAFEFTEEGDSSQQYTLRIKKCFYHNYFNQHSAPELTALFCEWDKNWIEPISPSKHGVRFERIKTLAGGGDSCPFTFTRTSKIVKTNSSC